MHVYIIPPCTQTALTFFVCGIGSSDFYTVRITPGWNAQKWYPCVYFRNRGGGTPLRSESILEKLDFQKGALFKKYIPYPYTPYHQTARKWAGHDHISHTQKTRNKKKQNTKSYSSVNMALLSRFFPRHSHISRISATSFAGRLIYTKKLPAPSAAVAKQGG